MFRLEINPAIERGDKTFTLLCSTETELIKVQECMADLLLFLQDELKVMPDYSNYFIKEKMVDGEWEEIE